MTARRDDTRNDRVSFSSRKYFKMLSLVLVSSRVSSRIVILFLWQLKPEIPVSVPYNIRLINYFFHHFLLDKSTNK